MAMLQFIICKFYIGSQLIRDFENWIKWIKITNHSLVLIIFTVKIESDASGFVELIELLCFEGFFMIDLKINFFLKS